MKLRKIFETALYVKDLQAAGDFYSNILGLQVYAKEKGRHLFYQLNGQMLLLFNAEETVKGLGTIPAHGSHGAGHIAFEVTKEELSKWREKLLDCGVKLESEIDWPAGGKSVYFRDPSGNSLEFATYDTWVWPEMIK